jgi:hypothetical protein
MHIPFRSRAFITLLMAFPYFSHSQTASKTLELGEDSKINELVRVGDSGFLLYTYQSNKYGVLSPSKIASGYFMPKKNATLTYYGLDLEQHWSFKAPADDEVLGRGGFVTSPETKYIYSIERRFISESGNSSSSTPSATTRFHIYRFNPKGDLEKITPDVKESSKDVKFLSLSSDINNLYYLSVRPTEKKGNKMVKPMKVNLYVMSHSGKQFLKKPVEVEFTRDGQIGFLGTSNGLIYFYQKRMDLEKNDMEIEVYCISEKGEKISSFLIVPKIRDFYAPLLHFDNSDGSVSEKESLDMLSARPNLNALGNLSIDFRYGKIYYYGLTNQKDAYFSSLGNKISDVFFQTYSLEGEKLSSFQENIETKLEGGGIFDKKVQHFARNMFFDVIDSNHFRLQLCSSIKDANILFLNSKKVTAHYLVEDPYAGFGEFNSTRSDLKLNVFANDKDAEKPYLNYLKGITDLRSKDVMYSALNFDRRIILVKYVTSRDNVTLTLMSF